MSSVRPWLLVLPWLLACTAPGDGARGPADGASPPAPLDEALAHTDAHEGLLPLHLDADTGRALVVLPAPSGPDGEVARLIVVAGLTGGVGSNDLGLDRGRRGDTRLVVVRRLGRRVLVEQQNTAFRAVDGSTDERRAVDESFATSVLYAADVAGLDPDGRAAFDLTPWLLSDLARVAADAASAGQPGLALDPGRCRLDTGACVALPANLEFEALLTFAAADPGRELRATVPSPDSVTVRQHVSLLALPDDGYVPRVYDPRAGSFAIGFLDYAAPLDAPLETRLAERHRLQLGPDGRVLDPIVYYVDRAAPEPVRSALLTGASWWTQAFERAGFPGGFRVELLPEGVDPLDARYDVIEWVHRATRGWSYGAALEDPRTGEILNGHVSLGSLRVRQDRLLFESLLGTAHTGDGGPLDPVQLSLARIRQLAAHEVGHTLGLQHDFAASLGFNGSVMDYPAPHVTLDADGELDVSSVYGTGIGPWDEVAIRWLYAEPPPGVDERAFLDGILADAQARGLVYLSDEDARPAGASDARANLWDDGADPVAALEQALAVRRVGLMRFGADRVRPGRPLAELREVLVPLWLYHRYQVDAAAKLIGGLTYDRALRGDGRDGARMVDGATQRRALAALGAALDPHELDLSDDVLALLLPPADGAGRPRERMPSATEPAFDALGAAAVAADLVAADVLQPERCARVLDFHRRDPGLPSLEEVLDTLVAASGLDGDDPRPDEDARLAAVRRTVQRVVVDRMLALASDGALPAAVRAVVELRLERLAERLEAQPGGDDAARAQRRLLARDVRAALERAATPGRVPSEAPPAPPGSPIGARDANWSAAWLPACDVDEP
ncbi:MAG: zinc-dependent metalloprotease [Planctomycetes bacterium]|nr:zinc-dependent metalloprotease [Planctomycetota bacterium]